MLENNSQSVVDVAVRVTKSGDGDVQTLSSFKQLREEGEKLSEGTKKLGDAESGLNVIREKSNRTLLNHLGVNREFLGTLNLMEHGANKLTGGFNVMSIATLGAVAAIGFAVSKTKELAAELDKAGEAEINSAKDLNEVLANRVNVLARVKAREDRLFNVRNIDEAKLAGSRSLDIINQQAELEKAQRGGATSIAALGLKSGGLGENQFVQADLEHFQLVDQVRAKQADINAELEKEQKLRAGLVDAAEALDKQIRYAFTFTELEKEEKRKEVAELERKAEDAAAKIKVLETNKATVDAESAKQIEIADKERITKRTELEQSAREKAKAITEQFTSIEEAQLTLANRRRGVEDARVAQAAAFLQIQGHSVDAERLITLELQKQKKLTDSQIAGKGIAQQGGLNVDFLASQSTNLSERSQVRNSASAFNQDLQRETQRLRRSGVTDSVALQEKTGQFATKLLDEKFPSLKPLIGVKALQPGSISERDKLIDQADVLKQTDAATKATGEAMKAVEEFTKVFGGYSDEQVKAFRELSQKVKANTDKLKNQ